MSAADQLLEFGCIRNGVGPLPTLGALSGERQLGADRCDQAIDLSTI
jgi:hypothetical protein